MIADHPAPWLRLRAQRGAAPAALQSFDQNEVQETLRNTLFCKPTLACALNSCCVVCATAGMVANRHTLPFGVALGRALRCYHSCVHPLPNLVLHNPIFIMDLDGDK